MGLSMMKTLQQVWRLSRFAFKAVVLVVEVTCWAAYAARQVATFGLDAVRGLWSYRGGMLHCPQGHAFALSGPDLAYDFECSCGWRWSGKLGSELYCPNPECDQPVAPYVSCPTCSLSCRNPFRWGRP